MPAARKASRYFASAATPQIVRYDGKSTFAKTSVCGGALPGALTCDQDMERDSKTKGGSDRND